VSEQTRATEQDTGAVKVWLTDAQAVFEKADVTVKTCPLLTKPLKLKLPLLFPTGSVWMKAGENANELVVSVPLPGTFVAVTCIESVYRLVADWQRPGVTVRLRPQGATEQLAGAE